MRLAVLDIGSNAAQLQVVDVTPGAPPLPAHVVKEPTLLGHELQRDGSLSTTGVQRAADAVRRAVAAAVTLGVDQLYPFVTAAIRDATNRADIIDRIEAESGIRPQHLTGEQEALFTYFAVHRWYGWSAGRLLLMDIGGGSMELAMGRGVQPDHAMSLPLGAGRLSRDLLLTDPPTKAELRAVRRRVRDTLSEVLDRMRWEGRPHRVIATSKTFKQLARLAGAAPQRKGPYVKRVLTIDDLRAHIPRLVAMTAKKRSELPGVSRGRAHQVVAGALVAEATMAALGLRSVEICPWALREGILLRHLEARSAGPDLPLQPLTRFGVGWPLRQAEPA